MVLIVGIFAPVSQQGSLIGASPASVYPLKTIVDAQPDWECRLLTTADLESVSTMHRVDVLIFPGGEPRQLRNSVTPQALRTLREWKTCGNHRGLVGICAGAVVACGRGNKGIDLVGDKHLRMVDDNRIGSTDLSSMVEIALHPDSLPRDMGSHVSSISEDCDMPYVSGPLFAVDDGDDKLNNSSRIWATYRSDVAAEVLHLTQTDNQRSSRSSKKEHTWSCHICHTLHSGKATKTCCTIPRREHEKQAKLLQQLLGVMPGTGAIVSTSTGTFRSVLFGPHPEMADDTGQALLIMAIRWITEHVADGRGRNGLID